MSVQYLSLLKYMYGLGVHIGSSYLLHSSVMNRYVLAIRKDYHLFDLNKSIILLKRSCNVIYNISYKKGNIYYSYSDFKYLNWSNLYYLKNNFSFKNVSFNFFKMIGGSFTNYKTCFLDFLWILLRGSLRKWYKKTRLGKRNTKKKINFFRVFILFLKKSLNKQKIDIHNLNIYWRCIIFLKNISSFFSIPDLLISLGSHSNTMNSSYSTINDFNKLKIPTIGIVENGNWLSSFTYFIPSNNNSFIVSFFFFSIFKYTSMKARFLSIKKGILNNINLEKCLDSFTLKQEINNNKNSKKYEKTFKKKR